MDSQFEHHVILYVYGGGFMGGECNEEEVVPFCSNLAKCGYVAVSIDYRLLRKNTDIGFRCDHRVEAKLECKIDRYMKMEI